MPGKKASGKYNLGSKAKANKGLVDLALPSGEVCQARRPGVQGLMASGILDSFDQLTAIVQTEHVAPNNPRTADKVTPAQTIAAAKNLATDKEAIENALWLMDRLAVYVVVQPQCWIDYQMKDEPDEVWNARQAKAIEDEALAIRDVDLGDKAFITNWAVGGSADLAAFREGTGKLLGDLESGEALLQSAE